MSEPIGEQHTVGEPGQSVVVGLLLLQLIMLRQNGLEQSTVLLVVVAITARIDPGVHDALARWAADEFRSLNAQVEMVLRQALINAGRSPQQVLPQLGPG